MINCKNKINILSVILTILSILCIILLLLFPLKATKNVDHINGGLTKIELKNNDELEYSFVSEVSDINDISLYVVNENRSDKCSATATIINDGKKIKTIKITNVQNKLLINFGLNTIKNSQGKEYMLKIKNCCDKNVFVYLYKAVDGQTMRYNDEKIDAGVYLIETTKINSYTYLWYPIMLLLISLLIYFMTNDGEVKSYEKEEK